MGDCHGNRCKAQRDPIAVEFGRTFRRNNSSKTVEPTGLRLGSAALVSYVARGVSFLNRVQPLDDGIDLSEAGAAEMGVDGFDVGGGELLASFAGEGWRR